MLKSPIVRRVIAWALAALVLAGAGYLVSQYGVSNLVANAQAEREVVALQKKWRAEGRSSEPDAPVRIKDGEAFATLRFPTLRDLEWPVTAGIGGLTHGAAWYPATAQPGQIGNFAVAGHRVTHGGPFSRILDLKVGDPIHVETRDWTLTYRVVVAPADLTVQATDGWVLDPVPGKSDLVAWQPIITLTTAQDFFLSSDRSVAFGVLESKKERS